jgi:hypothetical protein
VSYQIQPVGSGLPPASLEDRSTTNLGNGEVLLLRQQRCSNSGIGDDGREESREQNCL